MDLSSLDDYTVAWICALPLEAAAARVMLDKTHPLPPVPDPYAYELGELHGHHIVIAYLPNGVYGTVSAAAVISRMRLTFPRLQYGLMVGIGGGVPSPHNDIRLGDIVVSKPGANHGGVIQYDFGKAVQGHLVQTGTLNQPPHTLLTHLSQVEASQIASGTNAISELVSDALERHPSLAEKFTPPEEHTDRLFHSYYHHADMKADCEGKCDDKYLVERKPRGKNAPYIHHGLIASGNQVMKDSEARDRLAKEHGILCFEMEAAGLMNELPTLVIRGIADYCDSHKQKEWQGYAALTAAAFTKLLLAVMPVQGAMSAQSRHGLTDEDQRCLRDLLLSHPDDDLRRIEATKGGLLNDSFRWVLDNAEFRKWHNDSQNQLLWIKGDAGKGKTMLMIGLVKELSLEIKPQPSHSMAFFICQATDPKLNKASSILRGLIYMLIRRQPHLISYFRERYTLEPRLLENGKTFHALATIFENMVQDPHLAMTYLLVDAVDECETGLHDLLKLIAKTKAMSAARLKWIVSSRNRDDIEQELDYGDEGSKLSLELNSNHVSNAVAVYVDHRISRLKALKRNGAALQQVKKHLIRKSDGTFLWVALVVQEMQKCQRSGSVMELLEKTPRGLTPLYDRMLQKIQDLQGVDRNLCMSVLSIATLGHRPLRLGELCCVGGLPMQYGPGDLENIVSMCGSFLTIRDGSVYLIHQSAKDYLSTAEASDIVFPSGRSAIHRRIFRESLKCLSDQLQHDIYDIRDPGALASEIGTVPSDLDPLNNLRYSCTYWLDHFVDAVPGSPDELVLKESDALSAFFVKHLLHWLESLSIIGEIRHGILALKNLVRQQQNQHTSPLKPERKIKTIIGGLKLKGLKSLIDNSQYHARHQNEVLFTEFERFASRYGFVIQEAPLQAYAAALAFCPQASATKSFFWEQRLGFIDRVRVMHDAWDPCIQLLSGHTDAVKTVTFSPDGQTIMSTSCDGTIRLWDPTTGVERRTIHIPAPSTSTKRDRIPSIPIVDGDRGVHTVAFSPDGQTIASASYHNIHLWDASTGVELRKLKGHQGLVRAVLFLPDRQTILSISHDGTSRLWDSRTGANIRSLKIPLSATDTVFLSPDGQIAASTAGNGIVRVWDTATWTERRTQCVRGFGRAVAFSPDGRTLASVADEHSAKLWDSSTGSKRRTLNGHSMDVTAVAFSPDGHAVATTSEDNTVRLWDSATGGERHRLVGHLRTVNAVAFSPDGRTIASASDDHTVRLWYSTDGLERDPTLECSIHHGHNVIVTAVAFSPDGQIVASASADNKVSFWDSATGVERRAPRFHSHNSWVLAITFSPDGKTVASASSDKTVKLWNAATGTHIRTLEGHTGRVIAVAFSPDSQTLLSVSGDKTLRVWDPATGREKDRQNINFNLSHSVNGFLSTNHNSLYLTHQPFNSFADQQQTELLARGTWSKLLGPDVYQNRDEISLRGNWLTRKGKRLLRLPPEYLPTCIAVSSCSKGLVLGHRSGHLTFFRLN